MVWTSKGALIKKASIRINHPSRTEMGETLIRSPLLKSRLVHRRSPLPMRLLVRVSV
jgi:hypothetical protein